MIRSLFQVVALRDRTPVLGTVPGHLTRVGHAVIIVYAVVVAIVASADYVRQYEPDGLWVVYFAVIVVTYGLMIRSPLDAWRLGTAGLFVDLVLHGSPAPLMSGWQWCFYVPVVLAVAVHHSRSVVFTTGVLTLAVLGYAAALREAGFYWESAIVLVLVLLVAYTFGARGRAEQVIELERAEKGALEERARIAREMHDVVAHHMSMVVVRCETAPYRIAGLPDAGVREFAELGDAARGAITDMQRLLGVLRGADQEADKAPQPGLGQIPELAERAGATVDVPELDVPGAVGLTAYRIVQEALTNAARHAPGGAVSVVLRSADGDLEVVVRNTPGGASLGGGGGHGLAGMRERVAVHGGELAAGATGDGGFEVAARIPLGDK
ncbi:sensor histidine kinase [Umezawaea tangerina]|uniref:histidine kinase n=1 Tax=Umezawaea tangerina TaxID=84725 RepID=A0A2T0TEA8_9PSEU|nr:histidine kinase [Umezawaea tangerina]PRY43958.1 signal transduction histidine kinase [Umezawaea tangerina]